MLVTNELKKEYELMQDFIKKTDKEIEQDKILNGLQQFTGSEQYHKFSILSNLVLTDGVKWLCNKAGCYWFMDIIASYQRRLVNIPFQIWGIELTKTTKGCKVYCKEDSEQPEIITQRIGLTDFPIDKFELYCIDGVILLKSEY